MFRHVNSRLHCQEVANTYLAKEDHPKSEGGTEYGANRLEQVAGLWRPRAKNCGDRNSQCTDNHCVENRQTNHMRIFANFNFDLHN